MDSPALHREGQPYTTESAFILANTRLRRPPLVPEVRLYLAEEMFSLWGLVQAAMSGAATPPPFWGFAWAGGQALARYVLDHPETVRGLRVFDLASGSGLVAIAAALAGAASVQACDVDPYAAAAIRLNADVNGAAVTAVLADLLGRRPPDVDILLVGDIFYEQPVAKRVVAFIERAHRQGTAVLAGDPDRAYLPRERFEALAAYTVPDTAAIEDADSKQATVWRPR